MDAILDTNIFVQDFRMERTQFQELFRYLRRTDSSLVLPKVVFQEAVQKYRDDLSKPVGDLKAAWDKVRGKAISDIEEYNSPVDIDQEVSRFKRLLRKPAPSVKVYSFDDYSCVSVEELVRRGIGRIRPADTNGEELRDVILWLMVLAYAKQKRSSVAFISGDGTFQDSQGNLNETLTADLAREEAQVSYYKNISAFITDNSLETEDLSERQLFELVERVAIQRKAADSFGQGEIFWGRVKKVKVDTLDFLSAKKYRVAEDSFYVEGLLNGKATITVDLPNMLQDPSVAGSFISPYSQILSVPVEGQSLTQSTNFLGVVKPALASSAKAAAQVFVNYPWSSWSKTPYSGIPLSALALVNAEKSYGCSFELEVSARLETGKMVALQVDEWKIDQVEPATASSSPESDLQG